MSYSTLQIEKLSESLVHVMFDYSKYDVKVKDINGILDWLRSTDGSVSLDLSRMGQGFIIVYFNPVKGSRKTLDWAIRNIIMLIEEHQVFS